jgi:alkylhydroperoxidase family enzyme
MGTNYQRAFNERPEVYAAWVQLNAAIKEGMDLRRYELATLAAARRLRSSYCSLAHGTVLLEQFGEPLREIALDHRSAGLDEVDVAVMDLAERVGTTRPRSTTPTCSDSTTWDFRTPTSWTSCSPPQRAASSRRRSTPWASCPTRSTATWIPNSSTRSSSAAR